jgi:hypothetical protein
MKSRTNIFSFAPSVRNAEINSGSVYSLTVNECIGPRPLANHKTLTFKTSDSETIFSAESAGFSDLSHFLTTCADTPTRLASDSVSVTPAASIDAFNLAPKFGMVSPFSFYENGAADSSQDVENKVSHLLRNNKFSFAAASPVAVPPLLNGLSRSMRACRKAEKFFHQDSVPFFTSLVTGNSRGNHGHSFK